jgi:tryptophan-rich sensory protein
MAGAIGAVATSTSLSTWYKHLKKPALAPSGRIISRVWIVLYVLMGISAYLISRRESDHASAKSALSLYRFQLMLNVLWSWAFFYLRSPLAGLAVISFLWLSILATIMKFRKISAAAAILLVPYLLWVSFATYLNYSLWRMNLDDGERIEDLDAASSRRHI